MISLISSTFAVLGLALLMGSDSPYFQITGLVLLAAGCLILHSEPEP